MTLTPFLVIIGAVMLEVLAQMAFKQGTGVVVRQQRGRGVWGYWIGTLGNGWIQLGLAAYSVELLFWVAALSLAPLSWAFPMMSLSYCGVALACRAFLGERLGKRNVIAIALIAAGVGLVAWPSP